MFLVFRLESQGEKFGVSCEGLALAKIIQQRVLKRNGAGHCKCVHITCDRDICDRFLLYFEFTECLIRPRGESTRDNEVYILFLS